MIAKTARRYNSTATHHVEQDQHVSMNHHWYVFTPHSSQALQVLGLIAIHQRRCYNLVRNLDLSAQQQ